MFVSVCKAILKRSAEYQRRGLKVLRHSIVLLLGLGIASVVMMVSGHNPFVPEAVSAGWIASGIKEVITSPLTLASMINGFISGIFVSVFGLLMVFCMFLTVKMASYDVVINTPNVIVAWKVLRDVVNLFFVIILLIIAIGTTLRREQYMWNKNLPRFIIAVIFVNFSRTIVAFVTDFADVIQQTFVAGISSVGLASIVGSFGLPFFTSFTTSFGASGADKLTQPVAIIASGFIVIILELIVSAIMLVYFVLFLGRVILLWLIAVFGPVAFVSSILPQTQKYYKDWWSKLSQAAILGPMLTFFIWLAITLVPDPTTASLTFGSLTGAPPIPGAAAEPSFLIGVLMMVIILYFGMQQGMGMAGDFGSFVGKAQSFAFGTVLGGISGAAAFAGKDVLGRLDYGQMRVRQGIGKAMSGSSNRLISGLGGVVGAGGTIGNLRQAFVERQQEGAKRRAESGLEANKALATGVGVWPVLKLVELIQGKKSTTGAVQTTAGSAGLKVADIMQDKGASLEDRQDRANIELDQAEARAREELAKGNITQSDFDEARGLIEQHRNLVNVKDWAGAGRLQQAETGVKDGRARISEIDQIIQGFEDAIADVNRQMIEQANIEADPTSTPAEKTEASNRQADLLAERQPLEARLGEFEAQKATVASRVARYEALLPKMKQNQEAWLQKESRPLADELRGKSSDLISKGNENLAGGALGTSLVNLGQEYGTQQYNDQKARWDSAVKEAERQTDFDPDKLGDYLTKGLASLNPDRVQAALMGGAKKGKLKDMLTSGRVQPEVEKLHREDLLSKGYEPEQVEDFIKELRRAPGSQENLMKAQQLILKKVYGGNTAAASRVAGLIRESDHEATGASPAMTYTDAATGNTQMIEIKEKLENGKIKLEFDTTALEALNSELKGMKPGEFMYNLKKGNIFKQDADGNIQGVAALMKNYMKALPANFAAHVKNMSAGLAQAIKENQALLEEEIRKNPSEKEWQNMRKLLTAMRDKEML